MSKEKEGVLAVLDEESKAQLIPVSQKGAMFFDVAKFEFAQRVAVVFSKSTMVPEHFRNNIGNCIIALNYAERTGVDPFMCMQKMYIIHGKPAVETQFAVAMLNASGKFTELEFDMDKAKTKCVAFATKTKTGKEIRGPEVSLTMAKAEGWMSKKGSKWQTLPEMMLMYRSAIFFIRQYAPEVLLGMLSKEEVVDIGAIPVDKAEKVADLNEALVTVTVKDTEIETVTGEIIIDADQVPAGVPVGDPDEAKPRTFSELRKEMEAIKDHADLSKWLEWNLDEINSIIVPNSRTRWDNLVNTRLKVLAGTDIHVEPEAEITTAAPEPAKEEDKYTGPTTYDGFCDEMNLIATRLDCSRYLIRNEDELRQYLDHNEYEEFQMFTNRHITSLKASNE